MTIEQFHKAHDEMAELDYLDKAICKLEAIARGNDKFDKVNLRIGLDDNIGEFRVFNVPEPVFNKVCAVVMDYYREQKHIHEERLKEI